MLREWFQLLSVCLGEHWCGRGRLCVRRVQQLPRGLVKRREELGIVVEIRIKLIIGHRLGLCVMLGCGLRDFIVNTTTSIARVRLN